MSYERHNLHTSNVFSKPTNNENPVRNIYYGEVVSINDPAAGRRIRVRIPDFDNKTPDTELPYAYPIQAMHFWIIPQVGELVRIFIEDVRYPQRGRHWMGGIISQPQKIKFDSYFTALSTTNVGITAPDKNPDSYPEAKGVFPNEKDIALLGRDNTDIILKEKEVLIRAGKHVVDNILELNKKNPAFIQMNFFEDANKETLSSIVKMADRIAIISHDGDPKFKTNSLDKAEIERIFTEGHPLGRADLIVAALEIIREAILTHIHGYNGLRADPADKIAELQKIDFTKIMQNNIRIN